ncbi:MAG: GTPase domain-containing protein [Deltaproteobacteria bacterium]|nr:GTPase domain-containing protein [Deltaproteobacteria bacterium]
MSVINTVKKEINFKIVYCGPGLSGKTTTLQQLQNQVQAKSKTKIKSLSKTEKTLFFDFLPLSSNGIKGFKTRFQVYTVPGQPLYEDSRKLLLKGVDGIIFVVDSALERLQDNLDSSEELRNHIQKMGYAPKDIPIIIQYNKRDLPDACALDELRRVVNTFHVADFESVALQGKGILEPFQECLRQVILTLKTA